MQYAPSDGPMDGPDAVGCSWCRPLAITFTIILLVWHLIAVVTIEAAEHCAFSLLTMYILRAAGILLPLYAVMRVICMIQHGRRQYRLHQLLEVSLTVIPRNMVWLTEVLIYLLSSPASAGAKKKECIQA
uniref:Uncharacterized protein n=1 Tax=Aegilops tauschii subsp. strangulata TaxID=200361 RepID=A0A452YX49_AEGTS